MSTSEVKRLSVIEQTANKRLKQRQAMALLGISKRQVIRLVKQYRCEGAAGLVSKRRGKVSNHRHPDTDQRKALELVQRQYADFGPTLAAEKLRERDGLDVNKETLRQWMMAAGLWQAKRAKKAKVHQSRARRACFGELIQLDGSHHHWFEGRGERCCLYVLIDDATSQLVGLRFEAQETTTGYFRVVRDYVERHGRPLAFYSDKDSVFRMNHPEGFATSMTQFERAMRELDIELICANSPQAKGRVERANGTLQDRLVKEMRLHGISTMDAANAFLPAFMADYNRRFAVQPNSEVNAHRRELPNKQTLDLIFSQHHTRKVSKNLEISYDNVVYQLQRVGSGYRLRHAQVTVCEDAAGKITLLYKGQQLCYRCHQRQQRSADIVTAKQLTTRIDHAVKRQARSIPKPNHPWRHYVINPATNVRINAARRSSYPQGPQAYPSE